MQFGIQDDAWLEFGPGRLSERTAKLDRLGIDVVRVTLNWHRAEPSAGPVQLGRAATVCWARCELVGSSPSSPSGERRSGRTAARARTSRRFEGTTSSDSPRPRRSATPMSRSGSCGTSRTSRSGSSRPPRERTSRRSSTPATAASRPSIRKRVWRAESPARAPARAVSRRSTSSARWTPLARNSMRTPTIRIRSFPVTRRSKVAVSARR